jgi:RecA/RadA recombinase
MAQKSFFEELNEKVAKNMKGAHASIMSQSTIASISDWVKTPSYDLNRILSGDIYKGLPNRSLIGIVGPEHTMKSSFMVLCMAEAQKQGYEPVIIDTERGAETSFCKRWGLDTDNAYYYYSPYTDEVKAFLAQIKSTGKKKLIIGLDSAGGLDRLKSYEDALAGDPKADQGILQKEIRSLLKLFLNICIEQESIGIVTGHMYGSPGKGVPMPDQVGGGKAMRLFPSILINLKKDVIKDENKQVIGNSISATTLKNRMYPPFQTAEVSIDYKEGINPYAGLIPIMMEAGIIEKSGNTYAYKGERVGVGIGDAYIGLPNFPNALIELNEWLKHTGYSTVNEEIKQAEEMLEVVEAEEVEEKEKKRMKRK